MNDRDCENCAHHTGGSCSVWECSYEPIGDDTISRQAATKTALEFIAEYLGGAFDEDFQKKLIEQMNALPSVQPDSKESSSTHKALDTINRQDTIDAMEGVDWYHINKDGQLTHGANSKEDEPLYKAKDVYKVLNDIPSAQRTQTDTSNTLKALDCVERQAALDAISCDITVTGRQNAELVAATIGSFADRIKALPSAHPEIIRCKDCEDYQTDWETSYPNRHYCATMDSMMPEDGFCSYAERRTDE